MPSNHAHLVPTLSGVSHAATRTYPDGVPNKGRRGLLANDRDIAEDPIYDTEDDRQFEDIEEEQINGDP